MKVYKGYKYREAVGHQPVRVIDGQKMYPLQHVVKHSPDGLQWGYGGSGPADLALSILADFFGTDEIPPHLYQDFKWSFIAPAKEELHIDGKQIIDWLSKRSAKEWLERVKD